LLFSFQAAESRLQERETAGKLDDNEYDNARQRVNVIAHGVLAEAEHFHQHRVTDFNEYMQHYLMGQIAFFKTVNVTFVVKKACGFLIIFFYLCVTCED
jgi:hypothetical protein